MDIGKIDVCLVTKNSEVSHVWKRGLKHLPLNKLIVETSSPLGQARAKTIQKVETEWFAFIDDDVYITKNWFQQLTRHIAPKTGAVHGFMWTIGVEKWRKIFNGRRPSRVQRLKKGDRGKTHNTLIKTELVKDWEPSQPDIQWFEDYEITKHVLAKGYDWLLIPVDAYHMESYIHLLKQSAGKIRGWKKVLKPTSKQVAKKTAYYLGGVPYHFMKFLFGQETIPNLCYWVLNNFFLLWGILT